MSKEINIDSVCNWIKSIHELRRKNMINKNITIKLFKENNKQISAKLNIVYNKNTQHINFAHGLYYYGNVYYPVLNLNKLKCIDEHTKKQYIKASTNSRKNFKTKTISITLIKHIYLYTSIIYNLNSNKINIRDKIRYKNNYIKI